jgi:hypothetical protein
LKEIKEFIDSAGDGLQADRERALLCVAYDKMARRSELVGFDVEDVEFCPMGWREQQKPKDATMRAKCINDATLILWGLIQ